MDESSRDHAISRMMKELGLEERAALVELRRRMKAVKGVIALAAYKDWAVEANLLTGGPTLDTVNYGRVQKLIESKPYHSTNVLSLGVWDLIDLCNTRTFNNFRRGSGLLLPLDEVLLLTRTEYNMIKANKAPLSKQRNRL